MTRIKSGRLFLETHCHGKRRRFKPKTRAGKVERLVAVDAYQLLQALFHGLAQIVARPAELGIAAGDKGILLALQRSGFAGDFSLRR